MTTAFNHAITVYRALEEAALDGGYVKGKLKVTEALAATLAKLAELDWLLEPSLKKVVTGTEIEVEVKVGVGQAFFFAMTWADLLAAHNFKYVAPEVYYVAEDDFLSTEKKETVNSRRYVSVLSLLKVLREVADYCDESLSGLKFVYLNKTKLELSINYKAADLRDVPKVKELEDDIFDASYKHKEQRKVIIKLILDELLKDTVEEARFPKLLSDFLLFKQRYKDSYDLYIAEFSFEKVLEEVKAHKLDYTIKLNKVFSDIQNQLLAIPAALILIGSRLTPKGFVEWQNSLTMLGCVIFVALMDLLVRNQYNTLAAILDEINKQTEVLISKHAALLPKFKDPYIELEKRHAHQRWLIRIVDGLVAMMFLCCVAIYYWYSTNNNHWLKILVAG
ncbi:hypothetical protein H8K38_02360 [Undibacterium sp. FT79W]|uniref:hypothetical protein n=1 Tax=Undibacterium sp. FT79W TaxID=2762296 RepID=UPI00164CCC14|nr:hypothetical protein [Undibacterium sp. FT79W]MBC3876644.1 hypothetical protein [Undibacterium sp. FT79W]